MSTVPQQFSNAADLILDEIENAFGLKTPAGRPKTKAALVAILEWFCVPRQNVEPLRATPGLRSEADVQRLRVILKTVLSGGGVDDPAVQLWVAQLSVCDWILGESTQFAKEVQDVIDGCALADREERPGRLRPSEN